MTGQSMAAEDAANQQVALHYEAQRQAMIANLSPEARNLLGMDPQLAGVDRLEAAGRAASFQAYYANQSSGATTISASDAFSMASQAKAGDLANQQRQAQLATPQAELARREYSADVTRGINYGGDESPSFEQRLASNVANPAYKNLTFTQLGRARELGVSPAQLQGEAWKTPSRATGQRVVIPLGSPEAYSGGGSPSVTISPWQASFDKSALTLTANPNQQQTAENAAIQRFQRGDYWGAANASLKFGTGGLYTAFNAARQGGAPAPQTAPTVTVTSVPEVSSLVLTPEQARELVARNFGLAATLSGKRIGPYSPYPQPAGVQGKVTLGEQYTESTRKDPFRNADGTMNLELIDELAWGRNVIEPAVAGGATLSTGPGGYPMVIMPKDFVDPFANTIDLRAAARALEAEGEQYDRAGAVLLGDYASRNQLVADWTARQGAVIAKWAPFIQTQSGGEVASRAAALGVQPGQLNNTSLFTGTPEQYTAYTKDITALNAAMPDSTTLFAPLEVRQAALNQQFRNLSLSSSSLAARSIIDYAARVAAEAERNKPAALFLSPFSGQLLTQYEKGKEQSELRNPISNLWNKYPAENASKQEWIDYQSKEFGWDVATMFREPVGVAIAGTLKEWSTYTDKPGLLLGLAANTFNPVKQTELIASQYTNNPATQYYSETFQPERETALIVGAASALPALLPTGATRAGAKWLQSASYKIPLAPVTMPAALGGAMGGAMSIGGDVWNREPIDLGKAGTMAAYGAAGGAVLGAVGSVRSINIQSAPGEPPARAFSIYQVATEKPTGLFTFEQVGAGSGRLGLGDITAHVGTPSLSIDTMRAFKPTEVTGYGTALEKAHRIINPTLDLTVNPMSPNVGRMMLDGPQAFNPAEAEAMSTNAFGRYYLPGEAPIKISTKPSVKVAPPYVNPSATIPDIIGTSNYGLTAWQKGFWKTGRGLGRYFQAQRAIQELSDPQPGESLGNFNNPLLTAEENAAINQASIRLQAERSVSGGSNIQAAAIRATGVEPPKIPFGDRDFSELNLPTARRIVSEEFAKIPAKPGVTYSFGPDTPATPGFWDFIFKPKPVQSGQFMITRPGAEPIKVFDLHASGGAGLTELSFDLNKQPDVTTPGGITYEPLDSPNKGISSLGSQVFDEIEGLKTVVDATRIKDIPYLKSKIDAMSVGKSPEVVAELNARYEAFRKYLPEVKITPEGAVEPVANSFVNVNLGGAPRSVLNPFARAAAAAAVPFASVAASSYASAPAGYALGALGSQSASAGSQSGVSSYSSAYRYSSPSSAYSSPSSYSQSSGYPSPYAYSLAASSPSPSRSSASNPSSPTSQFSSLSSPLSPSPSEASGYSSPLYESPSASSPSSPSPYSPSPYSPSSPSPYDPYKIIIPSPPIGGRSGSLGAFKVRGARFSRLPMVRRALREDAIADLVSKTRAEAVFKRPARSPRREVAIAYSKSSLGLRVPTYEETTGELGKALKAMRRKSRSWNKR